MHLKHSDVRQYSNYFVCINNRVKCLKSHQTPLTPETASFQKLSTLKSFNRVRLSVIGLPVGKLRTPAIYCVSSSLDCHRSSSLSMPITVLLHSIHSTICLISLTNTSTLEDRRGIRDETEAQHQAIFQKLRSESDVWDLHFTLTTSSFPLTSACLGATRASVQENIM